jgi:riboflavin kinase/FMN adenylyltransferase
MNIIAYVCGEDYRFGKFGKGTVADLKRYADEKGQKVIVAQTELFEERKISTSYIKRILSKGNLEKANRLLETPYFITGTVYADRKMGHELGFPTLNININHEKHPLRDAVYAGHTYIDGKKHKVIINYGPRPTFDLTDRLVEAHVVDFEGDLYGKEIKLHFDSYMREIQKFSGKESLRRQLEKDLEYIKGIKND